MRVRVRERERQWGEGMDWTGCFLLPWGTAAPGGFFRVWGAATAASLRSGTALRSALLLHATGHRARPLQGSCGRLLL